MQLRIYVLYTICFVKFVQFTILWAKLAHNYASHLQLDCHAAVDLSTIYNLIKNSQAVKKGEAPKKAMVKKDVKSKVAAKKWL